MPGVVLVSGDRKMQGRGAHSQVMTVQHVVCEQRYLRDRPRDCENTEERETESERVEVPGHPGLRDKNHGRAGF